MDERMFSETPNRKGYTRKFFEALDKFFSAVPFAIDQEAYFDGQVIYLSMVESMLTIKGYDKPMMEYPRIIETLKNMAADKKIQISAILPEAEATCLDEMEKTYDSIHIFRIPKQLTKGYILFDDWGVSEWNSKEPTAYPHDYGKSCFRHFQFDDVVNRRFMKDFVKEKARLVKKQSRQ